MSPTERVIALVKMKIDKEKKNTLINHLFSWKHTTYGETTPNTFILWKKSGRTGSFYFVTKGYVQEKNGRAKVDLKTELNSFGRLVAFVMFGLVAYAVITGIVFQYDNSMELLSKRILLGLGILLIPVLLFRLVYRFERREKIAEIRSVLTSSLKTISKTEASNSLNSEQYISIRTSDKKSLMESLNRLSENFSDVSFSKNILLYKSSKDRDVYHINFVNEPDFERFMYFVNFLVYSGVESYEPVVRGYRTIAKQDGMKGHVGQRAMLFVPEGDDEYDNVHLAFDNGSFNAKFGFAIRDGYKKLDVEIKRFEETKPNKSDFELDSIFNPIQ